MDKEQVVKKVKDAISLIKDNTNLDYLVLFGSYAKGTNHKWSDIDLAIVSNNLPKGILNDKTRNILRGLYDIDCMFEPHFFRTERWETPEHGSFVEYIKKYGEIIYSNGSK
ncbi:MAG: hypothetical protein A3I68_03085 [Candidatus Melainabacteria bacterium RIFCSPLOWO2_02_FULL_35_15]|nr:MAG: hypothetical protein A3I68_03085 [Candidatus Melainabacteria bacterium RIFCSPLOWO2_02_FULL_35_15]